MIHYMWPELGEQVKHKTIEGKVVSRSMGEMSFRVHDNFGEYFEISWKTSFLRKFATKVEFLSTF